MLSAVINVSRRIRGLQLPGMLLRDGTPDRQGEEEKPKTRDRRVDKDLKV